MKILLIKMSSMGDIIHTLPALTDAQMAVPDIQFDWVVEPAFADIAQWHPAVHKIIPINLRYYKKHPIEAFRKKFLPELYKNLNRTEYDFIIDPQGLLKSAIVGKMAKGLLCGYDKKSAREKIASYFYQKKYSVDKEQLAILRIRELFSQILNYSFDKNKIDYQINTEKLPALNFALPDQYIVFLHGTTWPTKHYPEKSWVKLLEKLKDQAITVLLPWGNQVEKARAERLASGFKHVTVLPKLSIAQMATVLKNAKAVVTVDTGLGHLSSALKTQTIALYGPTYPRHVGMLGDNQFDLCAESQSAEVNIDPEKIWAMLEKLI